MHKRNDLITTPKDEMRTPPCLFEKLNAKFPFTIDLAATPENALCTKYFNKSNESPLGFLNPDTHLNPDDIGYCNPPYNRVDLPRFVQKCYEESLGGAMVAMLLPVDFSARWWDYCMDAAQWIRIKGRIHFNGLDNIPIPGGPFFSSVVVVFDTDLYCKYGFALSEMGWK